MAEVQVWADGLAELGVLIGRRFSRSEPRERVMEYIRGLLSAEERKNSWTLSERAGEATPDGMQRLLSTRACLQCVAVVVDDACRVSRFAVLSDEQWARVEPFLPSSVGKKSRPFRDHRQVVEGIIYRYRTGIAWRDLPREQFGPWQTGRIPANDATRSTLPRA